MKPLDENLGGYECRQHSSDIASRQLPCISESKDSTALVSVPCEVQCYPLAPSSRSMQFQLKLTTARMNAWSVYQIVISCSFFSSSSNGEITWL